MENQIVIKLNQGVLNHHVYIFTDVSEQVPISEVATMENLMSIVAMAAAKYKIKKIKISGAKTFSLGIKDQLTEKLSTCFGKIDDFIIEMM